jgi:basic membrane lipoprotein Med (substrate-binding protein (PBP1-ABC) superfamily)
VRGNRFLTWVAGAVLGCAGTAERSNPDSFRVALLTPGPISDQAWNGEAYEGLLWIRDSLGASISHIQTRTPAEFDENFRAYGQQGYDLVIGHGFEFQDAATRVAPDFPSTTFAVTSSTVSGPNIAGLLFPFAEPSFLAGMVAGALTGSRVIGAIGGTELPPVRDGFAAFEAGAHAIDPTVRVLLSYVGNWEDVSAGRELAMAQIGQGADIIFQNADAAGLGVFQAARETRRALVIGSNADQREVAPEVVLASAVIDLPRAFLEVARAVQAREPLPGVFTLGTAAGVLRLVLNPGMAARMPPAVRARLDSTELLMRQGRWSLSAAVPASTP